MKKIIEDWLFENNYELAFDYDAYVWKDGEDWELENWPEVEIWYEEFNKNNYKYKHPEIKISFKEFSKIYDENEYELQDAFIEEWLDR